MKSFVVGGAVRDALLGRAVSDRDWVVVGATPQQMAEAGYLPVGKDFPVFLHPQTREEYALARTERKTARGYHGFAFHAAPEVTLEQDLARRDLTVNAMARDEDGTLVDPYGGQRDLDAKVLRHVTLAFREDPVRILRVARFSARLADFSIAPETMALMREMVAVGEVDALVAERVWQELARGLMEAKPSRMFEVLAQCGALERLLPELSSVASSRWARRIDVAASASSTVDRQGADAAVTASLPVRFACLTLDLGAAVRGLCERLRVPTDCRDLAELAVRERSNVRASAELDAEGLMQLLERSDALRKPQRFGELLAVCEFDAAVDASVGDAWAHRLRFALQAAQRVGTAAIAAEAQRRGRSGPAVGEAIHRARVEAIAAALGLRLRGDDDQATSANAA
ncbi:multifunctional CCA tRNA nucleotidyl transferase/2'3'-cyclic phosphodiesterase/2'nucleotidase/phosphatase [Ramlibacter sp.]|uniref:multifunctional CCA tRNA nucleotidyl transferase/2'3'-cyclic phosphodiesterase/2'nucleotidase/phosphatase n=1 Tax=Ramlibacter sp. TaxID=1917967 RepID=UPI003D132411